MPLSSRIEEDLVNAFLFYRDSQIINYYDKGYFILITKKLILSSATKY